MSSSTTTAAPSVSHAVAATKDAAAVAAADTITRTPKDISSSSQPERGRKQPSPLGTSLFVALRLLDPVLQYEILAWGWGHDLIRRMGGQPAVIHLEGPIVALGLPCWRFTLFLMALAGSIKGIYYLLFITEGAMPVRTAIFVGIFKAVTTTINSLLFCNRATSAASSYLAASPTAAAAHGEGRFSSWPLTALLTLSCAIYSLGMFVETLSEIQRKRFKLDPRNTGKPYTGGLFSLARHINYGGFTIWKSAYGLASSGWWWGAMTALWLTAEFRRRGIPGLDAYCESKVRFYAPIQLPALSPFPFPPSSLLHNAFCDTPG